MIYFKSVRYDKGKRNFAYQVRIFYGPRGVLNVDISRGTRFENLYNSFVFHKKSMKSALVIGQDGNTEFQSTGSGLYNMYSFIGQNPTFSSDSEYLLTYKGSQIWLHPINYERLIDYFIKTKP